MKFISLNTFNRISRIWQFIISAMGFVCVSILTQGVAYACTPVIFTLNSPATININPTLSVGSVVATTSMGFSGGSGTTDCGVPYNSSGSWLLQGEGTPNGNLYPTTIPGVAYREKIAGWPGALGGYFPIVTNHGTGSPTIAPGTITVEFIKTGPILPGTFQPQMLGYIYINNSLFFSLRLGQPIIIVPTTPACTITQSAIPVSLDDANTSQLAVMGNARQEKPFNIPLTCSTATNISLTFSGNVADSTNAVFSNLSGSANASSVGIQILSGGTPVPTTSGNYINLGLVNGSTSIPLTARYYALANNPDAGAVSAIAYATIVYN